MGQTSNPPVNALPSPLTAAWQPAAGQVAYVTDTSNILGSAADMTLVMDLDAIRTSIVESDLYVGQYRADATHGTPMIVSTALGRLFLYTDTTGRSSGHSPIEQPQYWRELGRSISLQPDPEGVPRRYGGGELIHLAGDVYLCLTAPPVAVDGAGIHTRPEFLNLTPTGLYAF